jgi:rare lipoprotein A (peptidoglycan hydrolase)
MLTPYAKKWIWRVVWAVVIIDIFVVCAHYTNNLRARFPNIDWSRAHIGIASWYSEKDKFINKRTANNEKFDDDAMTCASWYYPFHEKLLVINVINGKWTVCRVNDRGPAKRLKREIDLTHAVFRQISKSKIGLIPVTVIPIEKAKTSSR